MSKDSQLYLVTGGAGFIGCNLVRRLVALGKKVRVFDNFSTGKRENLRDILYRKIELIEGDLRDLACVMEATKKVKIIFHEAALPSISRSVIAPNTTNDVNITGTLNLLQAARANGVKRLIYASSSSVYGNSPELPKDEEMTTEPISPYAVSKLAGEGYCQAFRHIYGLETIILRYFNIFGPYQDPTSEYSGVIAKFINAFLDSTPLTVYGDGEQSRDFTYVDDVVEANLAAASCSADNSGEIFNVAAGKMVTLNRMIEILKALFKQEPKVIYTDPRPGDVRHSLANVSKLKEKLNFVAKIPFEEGLKRTVKWYKSQR
ncbi:MAG: SDR family oxidoreductase [Candidatus Omnitrophica bacterium]|nr:SDR family oxidoreductase [Candidatus Omnitrophota bacterium]